MRRFVSSLALAAAAFAAATVYRQWKSQKATPAPRRSALEHWENEGGAVPDATTTEDGAPAFARDALDSRSPIRPPFSR